MGNVGELTFLVLPFSFISCDLVALCCDWLSGLWFFGYSQAIVKVLPMLVAFLIYICGGHWTHLVERGTSYKYPQVTCLIMVGRNAISNFT